MEGKPKFDKVLEFRVCKQKLHTLKFLYTQN